MSIMKKKVVNSVKIQRYNYFTNRQLTLEQHRFELHRSTYARRFFSSNATVLHCL